MESTAPSPHDSRSPRWLRRTRNMSLVVLLCTPLVAGIWDVHVGPRVDWRFREVPSPDRARDEAERALVKRVADYWNQRPEVIDLLLPEGRGGTRFYISLDGMAGMAFPGAAIVGLSATSYLGEWVGAVELHERGHLVHAFLPHDVERLLARLPAPLATELAAEDAGQHFAEMPAMAWSLVAGFFVYPDGLCIEPPSVGMLQEVERRVPGTAGFVARFLEVLRPVADQVDAAAAVHDAARAMSASYAAEFEALWSQLDARRRADGTFEPWDVRSVRQHLALHRARLWQSNRISDRATSIVYLPGLAMAALAGL
jgi:hypothetical protein